jgi:hypothetical protein
MELLGGLADSERRREPVQDRIANNVTKAFSQRTRQCDIGGMIMKRLIAGLIFCAAAILAPISANAGERLTDGALGGLAGAVVFGPVGLVAGGVIGYTAGPHIACQIGAKRCYRHRARYRR